MFSSQTRERKKRRRFFATTKIKWWAWGYSYFPSPMRASLRLMEALLRVFFHAVVHDVLTKECG